MEKANTWGYNVKTHNVKTKRYCQTLDLKSDPELIATYRRLHSKDGIWPEILEGIKKAGILEMEIYLLGTRLFMIVELPEDSQWDDVMAKMASFPKQSEWETLTAQYQQASPGAKSDEKWKLMERIFHLYE